jgi:hypothetical protein
MNNTTIFICVVAICLGYFFLSKTESMTNISAQDQNIIDRLFTFITPETTFPDYINFLTSVQNTNLHIIDDEVFATFKALKKRNMLTKNDIVNEMKLI